MSIEHLCEVLDVRFEVREEIDLFLIDCEGLYSLEETTNPAQSQAMFALAQMSSVIALVVQGQVSYETLGPVRSLFKLSLAFRRHFARFRGGVIIAQRDVGVEEKERASPEEQELLRQSVDSEECELLREVFERGHLHFENGDLKVLCQPYFDQKELYWNSVRDFVKYTLTIGERRGVFSGQNFIDMFEEMKPLIMGMNDLENGEIPFEKIFGCLVDGYLRQADEYARGFLNQLVIEPIGLLDRDQLRRYEDLPFMRVAQDSMRHHFESKANELLRHVLEDDPERTSQYIEGLTRFIKDKAREQVDAACLRIIIEQTAPECLDRLCQIMRTEISAMSDENLDPSNFADYIVGMRQRVTDMLVSEAQFLNPGVCNRAEFRECLSRLMDKVDEFVRPFVTRLVTKCNERREDDFWRIFAMALGNGLGNVAGNALASAVNAFMRRLTDHHHEDAQRTRVPGDAGATQVEEEGQRARVQQVVEQLVHPAQVQEGVQATRVEEGHLTRMQQDVHPAQVQEGVQVQFGGSA
jgi:hypothetical protein